MRDLLHATLRDRADDNDSILNDRSVFQARRHYLRDDPRKHGQIDIVTHFVEQICVWEREAVNPTEVQKHWETAHQTDEIVQIVRNVQLRQQEREDVFSGRPIAVDG